MVEGWSYCSIKYRWKRCSQNPVNHLKWSFSQKWLRDEAVTFFVFSYIVLVSSYCSIKYSWKRCSQNPVNHLKWSFSQKWLRDEAVTFFPKTLHLKCLTGFWIHLWLGLGVRLLVGSCLTLSWRRSLSYRKQSIDLQSNLRTRIRTFVMKEFIFYSPSSVQNTLIT